MINKQQKLLVLRISNVLNLGTFERKRMFKALDEVNEVEFDKKLNSIEKEIIKYKNEC